MEPVPGYVACYFWFGILMIWQVKRLKYQDLGEPKLVGFRDFYWFFIVSLAVGTGLSLERGWLNGVLFALTCILFVGFWLDAVVMNQFSVQINRHVLRIYFSNTAQLKNETAEAWRNVLRKPPLAVFPLASLSIYFLFIFQYYAGLYFALSIVVVYCLGSLKSSKQWLVLSVVAFLTVALAPLLMASPATPATPVRGPIPNWIAGITAGVLFSLRVGQKRPRGGFFQAPSFLDRFRSRRANTTEPSLVLSAADRALVEVSLARQERSDWHGRFSGSHVVLITLESISQYQVALCSGQGAKMPVFETLARNGLRSKRHFCISPNTNNALAALYSGGYRNQLAFPHLETLHAQGYQSVMILPQDSAGFGLDQLLQQIGFQYVIDLNCFPEYKITNDERRKHLNHMVDDDEFYALAFTRLTQIRKPEAKLFLHIMNSQTHFPYETHLQPANDDVRIRYVQAIEEADICLGRFLLELADLIPLQETLMVYTADHGESLGERGYKAHSTAVTREQINVPFTIHHPAMPHVEAPFSTHFDVFPTLFDFLGIECDYPTVGSSLRLKNRALNEVLFSETRHGHTPSCFGHVGTTTKVFFDVSLDRYYLMDLDDQILKELAGSERNRYQTLLLAALQNRGLMAPIRAESSGLKTEPRSPQSTRSAYEWREANCVGAPANLS